MRVLLVVLLVSSPVAWAQNASCTLLADMAIVARAMAEEKLIQPQIVNVLARIYSVRGPTLEAMAEEAVNSSLSPFVFSHIFLTQCERMRQREPRQSFRRKMT
jgi:hypothetical protein